MESTESTISELIVNLERIWIQDEPKCLFCMSGVWTNSDTSKSQNGGDVIINERPLLIYSSV